MRLEWVPNIDRFVPEWRSLHEDTTTAHPFHSPEWVTAWYATAGRLFWPRILAGYEGRDLVMVWPFASTLRTWYIAGSGVSDYLNPLVRDGVDMAKTHEAITELRPALVDWQQLPEDFPVWPGAAVFTQSSCLQKRLPATYSELLSGLSPSLRQAINRGKGLRFEWVDGEEFLPTFFDLHRQRWATKNRTGAFVFRGRRRFHEAFARQAGRIWRSGILLRDDQPIGAVYGMRSGNRAFFYQTGFASSGDGLSPGTVMIANLMRRSIEEGLECFDFLRGEEPYKERWNPECRSRNVRQIWPTDASVVAQAALLHHRIDQWLRDKLES